MRRLEEELRDKDLKIRDMMKENERRKSEVVEVIPTNRNYLEELLYKSREANREVSEQQSKALNDTVNLFMARMV